jgi:asparagine synthase (glutamine-hydrolysing)
LYFGWDGRRLCFGSELKALRAFGHWDARVAQPALGEYLQYGYISGNRTIYEGVNKLLPGHRLRLHAGQQPVITPYWSVLDALGEPLHGSDAELQERLEHLLIDAFRYRMVADVPVGVFLSGGVDSSLLVALLAKHHDQVIRTFTIGFDESTHDESRWARKVAEHCGTQHTDYILSARDALDMARGWGDLFDEPFGDASGIPTLLVSRLASEQVKVVLSADGGDELFSGYAVYDDVLRRLAALQRIPARLKKALAATLSALPLGRINVSQGRLARVPAFGIAASKSSRLGMMLECPTAVGLKDAYASQWYPEEIRHLIGGYQPPSRSNVGYPDSIVDQMGLRDFQHYLPEDILTKIDRTTMAVSIEGREPLLDHRLAEFAFRLPPHLKRGNLGPKHVLKSILYRHVPRPLVDRKKQGFSIPLGPWLKGDLNELVHDLLAEDRIRNAGLMDSKMVLNVVSAFEAGNKSLTTPLWFLVAFEMWREHWG